MEFLSWLEDTGLSRYVRESDWGHPILLVFHAVGMAMVVGVVLTLSLRVIGFGRAIPVVAFAPLLAVAWWGFAINAASGLLIFCSNAADLIVNWSFQLKIALIVAGGVSVWALWRAFQTDEGEPALEQAGAVQKITAALSILFWLGALTAGRLIAYTLSSGRAG